MAEIEQILLVEPHGECFGVRRATEMLQNTVDEVENEYPDCPIICINPIVHNERVTQVFTRQGVKFITPEVIGKNISDLGQVYEDILKQFTREAIIVSSAHGVPPSFYIVVGRLGFKNYVDTTCPWVKKVQDQARETIKAGSRVIYYGKRNHPEMISVVGIDPEKIFLVENLADASDAWEKWVKGQRLKQYVRLTQTTLSESEIEGRDASIKSFFGGEKVDFVTGRCQATRNRQEAVARLAQLADKVIIIGSTQSNNTKELVEIAGLKEGRRRIGSPWMIEGIDDLTPDRISLQQLHLCEIIGITAGASTPECAVDEVVEFFKKEGRSVGRLNYPDLLKSEKIEESSLQ